MNVKKLGLFVLLFVASIVLISCGHKHQYSETKVEPTCTELGYTEYICECGHTYKDDFTDALGHSFGEWVVVEEATEEKEGLIERECKCGEKEQEVIEKLEHVHSFGEWVVVKEPTNSEEGLKERECKCSEKEQEVLPVIDETAPVFELDGVEQNIKLNTYKKFDAFAGVKAIDNVDGDITESITVEGEVDNTTRGTYEIVYTVEDSSGNVATLTREVRVVWDYATSFIGHAGSYYGIQNTEEAILYAADVLNYQAIEVDVKVTKDGVFVLCHDNDFAGKTIASTNYADLKDVEFTQSRNAGYPSQNGSVTNSPYTSKICTLERFLEICKEYDVRPVLELKGGTGITNSDQSNMGKLMKQVEAAGLLEEVILLGSAYNCLIWTRNNGYENVECQYLVDSCASETYLNRCLEYDFDISICVTYGNGQTQNTPEWIARYQEAGIGISTYTFTQYTNYSDVQKWINLGVDYVTCDWHVMSELTHIDNASINTHTVTFLDKDGNILKEAKVKDGRGAPAPKAPTLVGYTFVGWDQEISNITADLTVKPIYEITEFEITYVNNLDSVQEATFESKEAFISEFYTDMFNWFKDNVDNISYLTYSNGTYTMARNTSQYGTTSWTDVDSLRALNVYYFEAALSSYMYKPIEGSNSATYEPVEDNGYFLNTEPYRSKYINMNAYLLNCMNVTYTSYSKTYQQASNNRVQIFFRFHQWCKGTNIAAFDAYPSYYLITEYEGAITMPTINTFTIEEEVVLETPTAEGKTFVGWFLDKEFTELVTKLPKGTSRDVTLYAKWE